MSLFGRKDPTADWPSPAPVPAVTLDGLTVGPLRLGDTPERARPLGRPRKASGDAAADFLLDYGDYELAFHDGRLACAKFDIDGAKAVTVSGFELTARTTPLDILSWLGDASSDSRDGSLRWIDYEREGGTLALEFDDGRLDCVQLYSPGWA